MSTQPTVAVLGLGAMGHAFAANLLEAGFPLHVWNRTRSRADDLGAAGATVADSPRAAAEDADVVITMVPDGPATEQVLEGDDGALAGMKQGAVLAQMGTLGVEATDVLIARVKERRPDVVFIDAPVSGTKAPAERGQVLVLASGDREAGKAVEPVFAAIGKATRWLGDAGAASRMKLVVNAWLIAMMQGLAEAHRLAESLGFDAADLWSVLEGGPLAPPYAKVKLDAIEAGRFEPQMALEWGLKDARLALKAAGENGLPSLKRISEIWADAVEAGHGREDIAVVDRYLREHH